MASCICFWSTLHEFNSRYQKVNINCTCEVVQLFISKLQNITKYQISATLTKIVWNGWHLAFILNCTFKIALYFDVYVRLWFVLASISKKNIYANTANCSQILLLSFRPKFQPGVDEVQYVVLFLNPFLTMPCGNYCKVQYSLQQRNTYHDHCKANHHNVERTWEQKISCADWFSDFKI